MSQHAERARAISQARKLMEMTTSAGASENEAQMAMDRLSKIRQTFNLTLDEIVVSAMDYVTGTEDHTALKGCPLSSIVVLIGRFTDTKVWSNPGDMKYSMYTRRDGSYGYRRIKGTIGTYSFFGIDTDVEMAKFVFKIVARALADGEAKYVKSPEYNKIKVRGGKRRALISFRKGFATRIAMRLHTLANENEKESSFAATSSNDIVFVKEKVREAKFQEQIGIKLVKNTYTKRGITDYAAGSAGANVANTVNFDRPISGDMGSNIKLLT